MNSKLFLLVAIFLLSCSPRILAHQEPIEERDEKYGEGGDGFASEVDPETRQVYRKDNVWWLNEKVRRQAERDKELHDSAVLGLTVEQYRATIATRRMLSEKGPAPRTAISASDRAYLRSSASLLTGAPDGIATVRLVANQHDDSIEYIANITHGKSNERSLIQKGEWLNLSRLNQVSTASKFVLFEGALPQSRSWHEWLSKCRNCVLSSRGSANETPGKKAFAALLGTQPTWSHAMAVFNALPYERGTVDSIRERSRMQISGTRKQWLTANDQVRDELSSMTKASTQYVTASTAEKATLIREFQEGSSDVVVIFAHSDGTKLFLPGKSGSYISVEEIRSIKRSTDSNRVVILIACGTGAVNGDSRSIAEALVESKVATTVFAYPGQIAPSYIVPMLERLRSGASYREALPGLYQIVRLPGVENELYPSLRLRFRISPDPA